ncbi:hypothetical protein KR059_001644 [Drosophila kikkawai]|nr:hypothetical protein KR059_001644 [Drosophila kikkawai]
MEYGNGMQYCGYGQGGEGYEMNYSTMGQAQGYNQQQGGQESSNQNGAAALGGPGYRSPLRYSKLLREMNSRNGLYSGRVPREISTTLCRALVAQRVKCTSREAMETRITEAVMCPIR